VSEASIDVSIVTADTRDMTIACVERLVGEPLLARIAVVDNGTGADGTAQALRARFGDRVDVVELERPLGFAAANNRGAAGGTAPYVLYLNSDILVTEDAVATLLSELRATPGAVAAGGRLVDPDTLATQPEYRPRPFPRLANFAVILTGIEERWPGNPVTRRYHGAAVSDDATAPVHQPAAAALLIPRPEVHAVGGFDERFWFWFEDSDLLARLHRRGTVLYVPSAVFRHLGGGTFRRWSKAQRIRSVHHGIAHYGAAQFPRGARAALGALLVLISLPRIVLFGATGTRRSGPGARSRRPAPRSCGAGTSRPSRPDVRPAGASRSRARAAPPG
jgi:N-acetylglucosaminyl-diphospho-decaprenol L-rhamnosyltransferase